VLIATEVNQLAAVLIPDGGVDPNLSIRLQALTEAVAALVKALPQGIDTTSIENRLRTLENIIAQIVSNRPSSTGDKEAIDKIKSLIEQIKVALVDDKDIPRLELEIQKLNDIATHLNDIDKHIVRIGPRSNVRAGVEGEAR